MPLSPARKIEAATVHQFLFDAVETISIDRFENVRFVIERVITLPSDVEAIEEKLWQIDQFINDSDWEQAKCATAECINMAKQRDGRQGVLKIGWNFGIVLGVAASFGWPIDIVPPRTWQKVIHKGIEGRMDTKQRSWTAVTRQWPDAVALMKNRSRRGFNDGIADAICIGEYGRRKFK